MYIVERTAQFVRGFLLSYGPSSVKRRFWDKEYSEEKWAFAYNTAGDCLYPHLERYTKGADILDIGCGSGNTSTEMAGHYRSYLGVDISEAALAKARLRSQECGRGDKNSFACGDFLTYIPPRRYDVILFRESLYHIPMGKLKMTLDRYAAYLKEDGVFVVRLFASSADRLNGEDKPRPAAMLRIVDTEFDVLEKARYNIPGQPTVIVVRPKTRPN
jgi:2-polyprenyl-3-methyl-5-hydroxy-6-metoxy-1,4-benzoquinol methylase